MHAEKLAAMFGRFNPVIYSGEYTFIGMALGNMAQFEFPYYLSRGWAELFMDGQASNRRVDLAK